ncbi:MAG: hypothetical protein ACRC8D_05955 [Aeromonas sp.]
MNNGTEVDWIGALLSPESLDLLAVVVDAAASGSYPWWVPALSLPIIWVIAKALPAKQAKTFMAHAKTLLRARKK